jgi:hypothetical protein
VLGEAQRVAGQQQPAQQPLALAERQGPYVAAAQRIGDLGRVLVTWCWLRVISRSCWPALNTRQRSPSNLRSKIQAGSENLPAAGPSLLSRGAYRHLQEPRR